RGESPRAWRGGPWFERSRGRRPWRDGLAHDAIDAALLERPGDDEALDLRGALPDPVDAQLPEEPLSRVLAHVAAGAEHLDDPVGAAERGLRREELRERGFRVDDLGIRAAVGEPRRLAREEASGGGLGGRGRGRGGDALAGGD